MMKLRFAGNLRKNSSNVATSRVLPDWKYPAAIVSSYRSVWSPITVRLYGADLFKQELGRLLQHPGKYVAGAGRRGLHHARRRRNLVHIGWRSFADLGRF